jgi:cysteine desulfurase family protein (TIGR01976 family)
MNASATEIVLGPSTSLLLRVLSLCLGRLWSPGDEVIVTNCDHEANITPWIDLKRQGIVVKIWAIRPDTLELNIADLVSLITPRTRLVALTHASNILGTINPIRQVAEIVHAHGALICVDGVGYAPHRLVDVPALDADFYVFSFYKVYGPHHAVLFGKQEQLLAIPGINHYFIQETDIPYKFQPGSVNYELTYSLLGLTDYLGELAQKHYGEAVAPTLREQFVQSFDLISAYEAGLSDRLLSYLNSKPNVRIIGLPQSDRTCRVPTISFVVDGVDSATIPPHLDAQNIGIRYGDFYAKRLIESLGLAAQHGVVRVSFVHYNTLEECDRLITHLEQIL